MFHEYTWLQSCCVVQMLRYVLESWRHLSVHRIRNHLDIRFLLSFSGLSTLISCALWSIYLDQLIPTPSAACTRTKIVVWPLTQMWNLRKIRINSKQFKISNKRLVILCTTSTLQHLCFNIFIATYVILKSCLEWQIFPIYCAATSTSKRSDMLLKMQNWRPLEDVTQQLWESLCCMGI